MPRKQLFVLALFTFQFAGLLPSAFCASCTTQAQMTPAQRDFLANAARALATQIQGGDAQGLRADTAPAVAADFGGIMDSVIRLKPLIQQAAITVDTLYILDAAADPAGAPRTD